MSLVGLPYQIIWQILVVLTSAVVLGELFRQFGLPSVAGELLSGLILGPTLLGVVSIDSQINAVSTIALFFIIFLIGFEMKTETLRKNIPKASILTFSSFILPLAVGTLIAFRFLDFGPISDFIVALGVTVPSISIISVIVMQSGLLESPTGQVILASVVITDVIAFVLLAAVSQSASNTFRLIVYLMMFIVAFAALDFVLNKKRDSFQRMLSSSSKYLKSEDISYAFLIALGLLVSLIFQEIGIGYILGAFFAGLILHEELIGREAFQRISRTLGRLNRGFFIPLFFGFAGVEANLESGFSSLLPLALLVIVSVGISISLTYFAARELTKNSPQLAAEQVRNVPRQISVILAGRGAVGIIIVSIALSYGLISGTAYSLVIFATAVVSITAPILVARQEPKSELENIS